MGNVLKILTISLVLFPIEIFAQCGPTDHGGANWIITSATTAGGTHTNVGRFEVASGITLTVDAACKYLTIEADTIMVYGFINGDGKGEAGGAGGTGGAYANGSGNPGFGGNAGLAGYGAGGGRVGNSGGNGGTETQICGNFACIGNRDGHNGGGGGAGGGSGASYGGMGGYGGYGAFGSGFANAAGGSYGSGGTTAPTQGTTLGFDITWGSGGAGGGGGGGGWSSGTNGGAGGNGGGMVTLKADKKIVIAGNVSCNGGNGGEGGNGGGVSNNNSYTCSASGYNACGLCSESVFDAAGGAGGGAGGGSGGGILIESNGVASITGVLSVNGGSGGNAGTPRSTMGTCFDDARGGGGGGGGRIKIALNPCAANLVNPVTNVNGGSGGSGVDSGYGGNVGTVKKDFISQNHIALNGGQVADIDTVFCDFGDVPLISSVSPASGGLGTYTYQWEYSTTDSISGFSNYPGQVGLTLDPSLISTTTWYRRKAVSGSCSHYSNVVKAEVVDCSGIEDFKNAGFNVYPSPNSGNFSLELSKQNNEDNTILIYNVQGEIVKSLILKSGSNKIDINLNVQPGLYLIRVYSNENIGSGKIMIE
jgi:hypothetical protein